MEDENALAKRKPGGQPGNANSLKHGFYSRRFHRQELDDLETLSLDGLYNEVELLRVVMRRMLEQALEENPDLATWSKTLSSLARAATGIATLLRAQSALPAQDQDLGHALSQALADMLKELES